MGTGSESSECLSPFLSNTPRQLCLSPFLPNAPPTSAPARPLYSVSCLLPSQYPDCRSCKIMSSPHRLLIQHEGQIVLEWVLTSPVELGRQRKGEPEPFVVLAGGGQQGAARIIVAGRSAKWFSRRHMELEPLADGRVRVRNLSAHALIDRLDEQLDRLGPFAQEDLRVPFHIQLSELTLTVAGEGQECPANLERLRETTAGPKQFEDAPVNQRPFPALPSAELEGVVSWLQTDSRESSRAAIGSTNDRWSGRRCSGANRRPPFRTSLARSRRRLACRRTGGGARAACLAAGPKHVGARANAHTKVHLRLSSRRPVQRSFQQRRGTVQAVVASCRFLDRQGEVIGRSTAMRGRESERPSSRASARSRPPW